MTRQERTARREQRLKEELATKARALAQVQAEKRAADRVARTKRRLVVGTLADDAGLFLWDDTTLAGLFQAVALLRETLDPVAVLASLLVSPACRAVGSGHGLAHPTDGAAPDGAGERMG